MSVCVTNYVHTSTLYRLTTFMFICQIVNNDRFWETVLYSFIHKSAAVRFFEYAANSAGGERLHKESKTSRSRGKTGDIILLNESKGLSKMSLCALSYKRVWKHCNTGSCARVCVCAMHAALRSE